MIEASTGYLKPFDSALLPCSCHRQLFSSRTDTHSYGVTALSLTKQVLGTSYKEYFVKSGPPLTKNNCSIQLSWAVKTSSLAMCVFVRVCVYPICDHLNSQQILRKTLKDEIFVTVQTCIKDLSNIGSQYISVIV